MNKDELKNYLGQNFSGYSLKESFDFPELHVPKEEILDVLKQLKEDPATAFDSLFCETAIDRNPAFELVYHITSTRYRHDLVVKTTLDDRENPVVESVYPLWMAAELYEDEIYDMFGIRFTNHPKLRRIMLTDEWVGYPLRKDYQDEYMIVK